MLQVLHLATCLVCRTCWPACRGPRGRKPASPTPPPFATAKLLLVPGWQEVEGAQAVSFHWLVKKAIKVANQELISTPKVTVKRMLGDVLLPDYCTPLYLAQSLLVMHRRLKFFYVPESQNVTAPTVPTNRKISNFFQAFLGTIHIV